MLPDLAGLTVLMRQLLRKDVAFLWTDEINAQSEKCKSTLCGPLIVVFPFDPSLKTELLTDTSKVYGLGWALTQHAVGDKMRMVCCSSYALNDTHSVGPLL